MLSDFLQMHQFWSSFVRAEDGRLAASLMETRLENQQASRQEMGRRVIKKHRGGKVDSLHLRKVQSGLKAVLPGNIRGE